MKILLLEDDAILGDLIYNSLVQKGFDTFLAQDSDEAFEFIENEKFDLLIFDINVPGISGLDVLKDIRQYCITTPAIIITAYQDTEHLKKAFNNGCDDYIKKPFDLEELYQRIKNIAKRYCIEDTNILVLSSTLKLLKDKNIIIKNNKSYEISKKENQILTYLFSQKGRTVSYNEFIQNIWNFDDIPSETTIRVYIKNLRNILGKDKIKTIRGFGYSYEQ